MRDHRKKTKIDRVQLEKVQNKTKHVTFRLQAFVRQKNKKTTNHTRIVTFINLIYKL